MIAGDALENERREAWLCLQERTREAWLDDNGHVNVQFYFQLVARAIYDFMERVLTGGEGPPVSPIFFTLEATIRYEAELMPGEDVVVFIRPVARSEKTMTVLIRIYRAAGGLSAECLWKGGYVDQATRRIAPLSERAKSIFDERAGMEGNRGISFPEYPAGRELMAPAHECVSFSGTVQADWIDKMGHMGIEHYQLIFDRASRGYFEAVGFTREFMRAQGWGAFGMGSKIRYEKEMKLAEPFEVTTRMLTMQRKTATYRHEVWIGGRQRVRAAVCDHTSIFVDWKTRRSIEIPEEFVKRVEGLGRC